MPIAHLQSGVNDMELDFSNPFTGDQTKGLMNIVTITQQISGTLPGAVSHRSLFKAEENIAS